MVVIVPDRRDGQRDIDDLAVLASPTRFEMVDPLAPPNPVENAGGLVLLAWRQQDGDRLADHLGGRIAENRLGAAVPIGDDAVERLADDGIVRRGDDRGQPAVGQFDRLAPRNLDQNAPALDRMIVIGEGASPHPQPSFGVAPDDEAEIDIVLLTIANARLQGAIDALAVVRVDMRQEFPELQIRSAGPQQAARATGQANHAAGKIPMPRPGPARLQGELAFFIVFDRGQGILGFRGQPGAPIARECGALAERRIFVARADSSNGGPSP